MACICFVCSHTVHVETNEKTREKYREVIGMNLSPDSQLCYMCSHVVNKLYLFKETCLSRILEYPAVLSKKLPMKLQKSDLEIHILCPEKCDQFKQIHNNNTYQFNYSDDSNDYNDTEYVNDHEYSNNDTEYVNNDIGYSNNDTEYTKYDVSNDIEYINNDTQYIDSDKQVNLECDKIHDHSLNDQHNVIEPFHYQDYNVSNSHTNCVIVQSESIICSEDFNSEKNKYGKSIDYGFKNDNDMIDSNTHRDTVINDTQMNIYDVKMEIDCENLPETDLQNDNFENSNQIDENLPETNLLNGNFENCNRIDNAKSNNENPREETSKRSKKKSDKSFKRIILSVEKQKAELEANRKDKKYVEAEFKCFYCALSFLFKDTYQAHMMRHEESNGEYQCATCTLRFATPALLRIHAACHSERYLCRACGSYLKPRAKNRHSCYQFKEPQSVACHLCGNLLKDANGLQQHLKRVHASSASGRRYACNLCGDSYTRQGALRTHMIKHINRKFHCDQCPGTYSSPYTLAQHKRRHRGDADGAVHRCGTCGARYDTRKSLLAHVRNTSNHSTTTYECPICGRVCPNQKSLASHIQSVHSATKDYTCSMCPARYTNRKSLVRHVAAHTKQKPVRIVICHLCGTNFKDNSKLNRHLREVCKKAKEEQLLDMYD